jgi:hypothetical protein
LIMRRRILAKLGLAAFLVVVTALPARAGTTIVNKVDGVNFQYTATDTNGVLSIGFTNPFNFVTQINDGLVPQIPAEFAQLTLSPTKLTDDIPGLSGHFTPNLNSTKYGITSLSPPGAPNVVFDYTISFGQVAANGMTLTGTVALDPASALTFTTGGTTYDFSNFQTFSLFTLSLGTQDASGTLIYNTLKSGNGTFTGSAQFDQVVPEPSSMVLAGVCGLATVWVRRRRA